MTTHLIANIYLRGKFPKILRTNTFNPNSIHNLQNDIFRVRKARINSTFPPEVRNQTKHFLQSRIYPTFMTLQSKSKQDIHTVYKPTNLTTYHSTK